MDSTMIFVSGVVHVSDSSSAFSTAATFLAKYAFRSKSFARSAGDRSTAGSASTPRTTCVARRDRGPPGASDGPTRDVATPTRHRKIDPTNRAIVLQVRFSRSGGWIVPAEIKGNVARLG